MREDPDDKQESKKSDYEDRLNRRILLAMGLVQGIAAAIFILEKAKAFPWQ